MLRWRK